MKSYKKNNFKNSLKIFASVQCIIMVISILIYFFTTGGIIRFYAIVDFITMLDLLSFVAIFLKIDFFGKKKMKIKNKIYELLKIISVAFFMIFFIYETVNYYKDIPYAVSGQYSVITGMCTSCYVDTGGKASILVITIDNMEFRVELSYKKLINEGQIYKVEYLPNSKEVIEIYATLQEN